MDPLMLTGFILTSVVLIVVPGPNVLVVVSTSLAYGSRRGLQTVLGTSTAMAIQLFAAALGTSWFVAMLANGFVWLRWIGVCYLLYLGIVSLAGMFRQKANPPTAVSATGAYVRGFTVSLTNPKTILFFSAFLPQFVSAHAAYLPQVMLLSVTFLLLATLLDGMYALLAGRVAAAMRSGRARKIQQGVSGVLYLFAGTWLAALRKI